MTTLPRRVRFARALVPHVFFTRILLVGALCAASQLLGGCASLIAPNQPPPGLFHDQLFKPAIATIDTARIFAVDDAMRTYLHQEIAGAKKGADARQTLFNALYRRDQLKLEYDSVITRTASETFAARSGNCLSLAIMTAALARELNFAVQFQQVDVGEVWSRAGNLYFSSNHVNLVLDRKRIDTSNGYALNTEQPLVVDFIPLPAAARLRAQLLTERTVVAMFLNNRAAELLSAGHIDDAYWAARQAIATAPDFLNAYNTLGVIYQHHGDLAPAERALRHALAGAPDNTIYLSNLAQTLENAQRPQEAALLRARLRLLEPYPPFHFYNQGQEALARSDYLRARSLFQRELERVPDYHELHYWLAVVNYQLRDLRAAERHMQAAIDNSTARDHHDLYAAKRNHLRAAATGTGGDLKLEGVPQQQ
jgi:tetratricopeptide (TPR) repeat protein